MEVGIDLDGGRGRGGVACETGLLLDLIERLCDGNLFLCGLRGTARALRDSVGSREDSEEDGFEQHPVSVRARTDD